MSDIEDIFEDPTPEQSGADAQPEQEEAAAPIEPEQIAGEQQGEPPSPEPVNNDAKIAAFQRSAEDERHKRQELERQFQQVAAERQQLVEYFQQLQQQAAQQAAQQEHQQVQDSLLDPQAYQMLQQEFQQSQAGIAQQTQQTAFQDRVRLSQEMMRMQNPDYDDMEREFMTEADRNPALYQQLTNHPVPAKFVYEQGKRLAALRQIGPDPAAYEQQLRQKIMQELQAQEPQVPGMPQTPPPPTSLANEPSSGGRMATQNWTGPTSLEDILK